MSSTTNGSRNLYTYDSFGGKQNDRKENHFLWWCAGADRRLLSKYPSEHSKYSGLGGVLIATFLLAALAGGYALYTVFENILAAIVFGILWGLIIFNLDRFLVSTMRKYGISKDRQFMLAIPRIILALLIGLTIARPLELKIFDKEIAVKVQENMHQKVLLNDSLLRAQRAVRIQDAGTERNRLMLRKTALEDTLFRLQRNYIQEADGTGGSGRRGIENLTRLKMTAYQEALTAYKPEIDLLDRQLAIQDSLLASAKDQVDKDSEAFKSSLEANIGFLERNKALSDLQDQESSVFWASLLISLLIIMIEIAPVLSKLIMQAGPYDIALGKEELLKMAYLEDDIRREKTLVLDRSEAVLKQKLDLSKAYLLQLGELRQRQVQKALERWEKGLPFESTGDQNLDDLLEKLRNRLEFTESNIL